MSKKKRVATRETRRGRRREAAFALSYTSLDELPEVKARGMGQLAESIIQIAKENNIPIESDSALTDLLGQVRVGDSIPPESFSLVAEIMSFLYHMEERWRSEHQFLSSVMGDGVEEEGS